MADNKAVTLELPLDVIRASPGFCLDIGMCLKDLGLEGQEREAAKPKEEIVEVAEEDIVHDDNDWGIELMSETMEEELQAAEGAVPDLVQGVTVAYTTPAPTTNDAAEDTVEVSGESLEELMKKMQGL